MEKSPVAVFYMGVKKVNLLCATLAGILLLFVTLSIFVDVFLRYVFSRPSIWITEVSTYLFLYIIYLATAYTLQVGTHIKVTFLLDPLGPGVKRIVDLITSLFGIVFTVVLLWQSSLHDLVGHQGEMDLSHHPERPLCLYPRGHGPGFVSAASDVYLHHDPGVPGGRPDDRGTGIGGNKKWVQAY